ncbi:hypothetical protein [Paenibacillus silvisoli]|nr:hypothetical protein [Paenibacillus silvisoli]
MENKQQRGKSAGNQNAEASKQRGSGKAPESEGYDKKLDGPNRPSI